MKKNKLSERVSVFGAIRDLHHVEYLVTTCGSELSTAIRDYVFMGSTYADFICRLTVIHTALFRYDADNHNYFGICVPTVDVVTENVDYVDRLYKKRKHVDYVIDVVDDANKKFPDVIKSYRLDIPISRKYDHDVSFHFYPSSRTRRVMLDVWKARR